MARVSASSARAGRAAKSARPARRRGIDLAEIPEASPAQLQAMRRVGRPPLGAGPRRLISIRIDPEVLAAVRQEAKRRRLGYQSLINDVRPRRAARSLAGDPRGPVPHPRRLGQGDALDHPPLRRPRAPAAPLAVNEAVQDRAAALPGHVRYAGTSSRSPGTVAVNA